MKKKILIRSSLLLAATILLSGVLLTTFAEVATENGCPQETGGFASRGIRVKRPCTQKVTISGYWWHIGGEVKWVGTVFASMKGEFKYDTREIESTGQEYTCTGDDKICWVCNCYYSNLVNDIE